MCSHQGKPWEIREAVLAGEVHAAPWAGVAVSDGPGMSKEIRQVSEQLTYRGGSGAGERLPGWRTRGRPQAPGSVGSLGLGETHNCFPNGSHPPRPALSGSARVSLLLALKSRGPGDRMTGSGWFMREEQVGEPQARGVAQLCGRVRGAQVPRGLAACGGLAVLT